MNTTLKHDKRSRKLQLQDGLNIDTLIKNGYVKQRKQVKVENSIIKKPNIVLYIKNTL